MGLFSGIGKALGGLVKGVGKVAKTGLGVAKFAAGSGLIPIPGVGGLAGKAINVLLASKRPMATPQIKLATRSPQIMRGNVTQAGYGAFSRPFSPGPAVLRMTPTLPGGAVATPSGIAARTGAAPPATFGRAGGAVRRRKTKKRATSRKRATTKRRGRKLKFGSPAWRKKYLGKSRRKRR